MAGLINYQDPYSALGQGFSQGLGNIAQILQMRYTREQGERQKKREEREERQRQIAVDLDTLKFATNMVSSLPESQKGAARKKIFGQLKLQSPQFQQLAKSFTEFSTEDYDESAKLIKQIEVEWNKPEGERNLNKITSLTTTLGYVGKKYKDEAAAGYAQTMRGLAGDIQKARQAEELKAKGLVAEGKIEPTRPGLGYPTESQPVEFGGQTYMTRPKKEAQPSQETKWIPDEEGTHEILHLFNPKTGDFKATKYRRKIEPTAWKPGTKEEYMQGRKAGAPSMTQIVGQEKWEAQQRITSSEFKAELKEKSSDKDYYDTNASNFNALNKSNEVAYWDDTIVSRKLRPDKPKGITIIKLTPKNIKDGWTPKKVQEFADSHGMTVGDLLIELETIK